MLWGDYRFVTPAQAGVQVDSRIRGNDIVVRGAAK